MKKLGEYTVLGQLTCSNSGTEKILLFDGSFETGYKVTDFVIEFQDRTSSLTRAASGTLYTENLNADNTVWNWQDNYEIGWAKVAIDSDSIIANQGASYINEENMIIEDLYVGCYCQGDADAIINYKIVMEKYAFSDDRGALNMVRNRSQA